MLAVLSLAVGLGLVFGGRSLKRLGRSKERAVRDQAVFALAANRGGVLTARDVATALGLELSDADALLTDLTKGTDEVTVELDNEGGISYRFAKLAPARRRWPEEDARRRVDVANEPMEAEVEERVPAQRARSR